MKKKFTWFTTIQLLGGNLEKMYYLLTINSFLLWVKGLIHFLVIFSQVIWRPSKMMFSHSEQNWKTIILVPGSLPWVNRLLLLTFLKRPIIYRFIEVSNSHKIFFQAAYNWIYVITFSKNFLSSWKKKLLLKSSQYSHLFLLKRDSLVKKRLQHSCFPVNIANCFGTLILKNSCERLPLHLTLGSQPRVSS